jgi:hypothetical protein
MNKTQMSADERTKLAIWLQQVNAK